MSGTTTLRWIVAALGVLLGGCAQDRPDARRNAGMCHDLSCLVTPNLYNETHRVHLDATTGKVQPEEMKIVRDKWRADVAEVRGLKGRILLGADYVDVDLVTCGRRSSGVEECRPYVFNGHRPLERADR